MSHRYLLIACGIALTSACATRSSTPPPRTGAAAAAELERFREYVEAVHPEPYRFTSQAELASLVAREAATLRAIDDPTNLEVGRAFQRVVASVHDSHMAVAQPAFQVDATEAFSVLPIAVELIGDRIFVDASLDALPVGTTVSAIDGVAADALVAELSALVVYEGTNGAARRRALGAAFVPTFHIAYGMKESYVLDLVLPDGSAESRTVAGIGRDAYADLKAHRHSASMHGRAANGDPLPTLVDVDASTSVLRLPTFGVADTSAFEARMNELLPRLATRAQLILDLRGNEGGYRTYGIALLNHLVDAPYVQWLRTSVRVRRIPAAYRPNVAALFGTSLTRLNEFPSATTDALHSVEGDPLAATMVPTSPRIPARLVVLVDGSTNSAANELALALHRARPDATFIGEEIGGECERHVGELPVSYTTPIFRVAIAMSLIRIDHVEVEGCAFGRGWVPDVGVEYDAAHFVSGEDPYVEAASIELSRASASHDPSDL